KFGSTKTAQRDRKTPIPHVLVDRLRRIKAESQWTEPDDVVFVSTWRGIPVHARNIERRDFVKAGKAAGIPFSISWHVFRRAFASGAKGRRFESYRAYHTFQSTSRKSLFKAWPH